MISLHFLYNFLGMLISVNGIYYTGFIYWLNYGVLYWGLFVFGILLTLFALKKIPSEAKNLNE